MPDERSEAATALLAFSIVIGGSVLIELLMRLIVLYGPGNSRYWSIALVNGTLFPICALSAYASRYLGLRSLLVSLGSFATLWASMVRFRGLWVWSGTFDAYWLSANGWLLSALGGFGIGSLSLLLPKPRRAIPSWGIFSSFATLAVAALTEYIGGRVFYGSIDSVYAETRHVIIAGVAAVLAIGFFFGEAK